jgi:epsilon-lactone hydrolase
VGPAPGGARLALVRAALRLRRSGSVLPLPIEAERAWSELLARTNRSRWDVPRARLDIDGIPVERVDGAGADPAPAILYLHGGSYTHLSPRVYRPLTTSLARAAEATLYAPYYRRAPEHPCPAAIDDALKCYRGVLERGHEPARIALAGDSAGAGLCVSAALALRHYELPAPGALALISPWVDLTLSGESIETRARSDVVLRRSSLEASARMYRGALAAADPRCSPLFAELAGLPPILIQAAVDDILLSDSERLAQRAHAAGVQVELELHEGLMHVFQLYPAQLREAEAAIGAIGAFLIRRWSA